MSFFSLEDQLVFYGSYHQHPVNVGIHVVCVPLLLWTAFLLESNTGALVASVSFSNLGVISSMVYGGLYFLLDPVAAGLLLPLLVTGSVYASGLVERCGWQANKYALAVHLGSWVLQFIGHGAAEGRAPALMDNLFQAIFLAPFFVWMKVLFTMGYRPALKRRMDTRIQENLQSFNRKKGKR